MQAFSPGSNVSATRQPRRDTMDAEAQKPSDVQALACLFLLPPMILFSACGGFASKQAVTLFTRDIFSFTFRASVSHCPSLFSSAGFSFTLGAHFCFVSRSVRISVLFHGRSAFWFRFTVGPHFGFVHGLSYFVDFFAPCKVLDCPLPFRV